MSCPDQVRVFLTAGDASTYAKAAILADPIANHIVQAIEIAVGSSINWDGNTWTILNLGEHSVALLGSKNQLQEFPNDVFKALVQSGKVTALPADSNKTVAEGKQLLQQASLADQRIANARYSEIEAFLAGTATTLPNRTQYRWISQYGSAEKAYGRGYLGLLPHHQDKGNHLSKLDEQVRQMMAAHIESEYETLIQPSVRQAYRSFQQVCEQQHLQPPSRETYRQAVKSRPRCEQLKKRKGSRVAYQEADEYWHVHRQDTPLHGERPFEIGLMSYTTSTRLSG